MFAIGILGRIELRYEFFQAADMLFNTSGVFWDLSVDFDGKRRHLNSNLRSPTYRPPLWAWLLNANYFKEGRVLYKGYSYHTT